MLKPDDDRPGMVAAICLIKAVPGQEKLAFRTLKEISGIKSLYHIFGDHDLFMILEAKDIASIRMTLKYINEMPCVDAVKALLMEPNGKCSVDTGCSRSELFSAF